MAISTHNINQLCLEIAGGSVPGQAHVATGRNNQDAFYWVSTEKGLVAVVCDGCGSGAHSEVGAKIGARLLAEAAARLLPCGLEIDDLLEQAREDVLGRLRVLATEMGSGSPEATGARASFSRTVSDYFLFTVVGVIVTAEQATAFSLGDGLIVTNGDRDRLGPFPNDEPPYLGYALLSRGAESGSSEHSAFRLHRPVPVEEMCSLLLGTDGAVDLDKMADRAVHGRAEPIGPLSQFWTDDRFFRNSDMVRRRLSVINRGPRGGALPDDTTLVVVRKGGGGMTMDVYLRGKRIKLDPRKSLGKGGEADVFDLGAGVALKVFKSPDHPDYQGLPFEQKAAEERILAHQRKLREFPTGLPRQVVVPTDLATDRGGRFIVGYTMPLVTPAEPLLRYADPSFRRAGVSSASVVALFRDLHAAVVGLHGAGVVIGDFNDLNVLVTPLGEGRLIDADSFQFGPYLCSVFTERFVDPLLCDPRASSPRLARPYNPEADWYAYSALLLQSLLLVGPYGGIYRPKEASRRIPQAARPLGRISIFHPEVQYPKPATRYEVLPDELLAHFQRVFDKDERGPFPARLLHDLHFSTCRSCAVEHARAACPLCSPNAGTRVREVIRVRGKVVCKRIFETTGVIVHACVEQGELRFLYHDGRGYHREDGSLVIQGDLDPSLRFRIFGATTLVGRTNQVAMLSPGRSAERLAVDSDGTGPAFDTNGRHRYWTEAGRLLRDAPSALGAASSEAIGDVLEGQTRIWAGPTFGLGLYRASNLSVAFTFDSERRGINDTLRLPPLRGQLVDAACFLDDGRAWLLLALHGAGKTRHLCLTYSRAGVLEASAEAEAGDGSWLGTLRGKVATQAMLLAATDAGVSRIEVDAGKLQKTRDFPDTEPFVDTGHQLLVGKQGLYAVGPREIAALRLN